MQKEEPERQNNILPGMGVELAANDYLGSADLVDSEGNKKGHYIRVGWSQYSHGACGSKKDFNNWVIAGDENGYTKDGKYYRVIYDTRFQNAFAVWATDNDENSVADFLEIHYTITLDLNGGTPTGDSFPHTNSPIPATYPVPVVQTALHHMYVLPRQMAAKSR